MLKQGKYDDFSLTSYGRLGHFFDFMFRAGVLKIVKRLGIHKRDNGINIMHLALLWFAKAVLGFAYVDNLKFMFRDKHLMRLCGFTPQQIEEGYSKRSSKRGLKPVHTDSVRNFGSALPVGLREKLFTEVVQVVKKKELIKGGVFALDAKFVTVEGNKFEFADRGLDLRTDRMKQGYKLFLLQNIHKGHEYIVCAALKPATQGEASMMLPMVEKALEILGKGAIKTLLIDRGYLSGPDLYKLKYKLGIDFIIPGKSDLDVVRDAKALSKAYRECGFRIAKPDIEVAACPSMNCYVQYSDGIKEGQRKRRGKHPGLINVLFVRDNTVPRDEKNQERIWSYLTSLPMDTNDTPEQLYGIYRLYRLRWVIENNAFKELSSYWNLTKMPGGKFNTINCHMFFTFAAYNLVLLFKSKEARRMMGTSVVTFREAFFNTEALVAVYFGGSFGLFKLEELLNSLNFR